MAQQLRLIGEAIGVERLDGVHDAGVKSTALLVEETGIGHLVSERVLERVLDLGKEAGLVEELGRAQGARGRPGDDPRRD